LPNIKSQKKRMKISAQQHTRNRSVKSSVRTAIKRFESAAESGDAEEAQSTYREAARSLDKAASKGVLHKNKAANEKSRLSRTLNQIT
jgi:small subunit ribosomal protein S20